MKRDILILAAAILMGVAAVAFAEMRVASIERQLSSQISNQVPICVLKQAVGAQTMVTEDNLESRNIPDAYRHQQSILWKERARIVGQRLRYPIQPGQQLLWSDFIEGSRRTIGGSILANRGVVTVPVDLIGGVSGLISPGSRVDIIGVFKTLPVMLAKSPAGTQTSPAQTQPDEPTLAAVNKALVDAAKNRPSEPAKDEFFVVTVARNLGVFAVGNQTQMDVEQTGARGGYGTISFDVPKSLQTVLIMAVNKIEAEGGRLVCVLRSNEGGDESTPGDAMEDVHSSEEFLRLIGQAQNTGD